jgi:hypothetical protein
MVSHCLSVVLGEGRVVSIGEKKREEDVSLRAHLVNHAVPGVACVVDDDVDFAVAELCGLLDERLEVFVVEHVAR